MGHVQSAPLAERFPVAAACGAATAMTEGDVLCVATGAVERRWRWTGAGLVTVGFRDLATGREWVERPPSRLRDWSLPGDGAGATPPGSADAAVLLTLAAGADDDEGFTSPHLRVAVEVHHPDASITVRYVIWAYPGAPGLRTQLWVRGRPRTHAGGPGRVDNLPVSTEGRRCLAFGYYNDTQHRNTAETPVLRAEEAHAPGVDWASALCVEDGDGGLTMIKESHKCVNQAGVDTGGFTLEATGLANTGWGLSAAELDEREYRWCWASWTLAHGGGETARQLAVKRFDRLRFPPRAERDLWTVACTWGESEDPRDGRNYAAQAEVLRGMPLARDMGIDMLLIDDGWQVGPETDGWKPDGGAGWRPHPGIYPEGWQGVRQAKEALGLRLGLWAVAQDIPLEDMVWNWRQIGMEQLKLDFAVLRDHAALDGLMRKVRAFMLATGQRCIVSWDTTENAARYGYFWAREYGNVHFMNRKPQRPASVVYVPWLALRDFWQLARYQNLNKWQLTIHNPEVVDRELSDAHLHTPEYCVATALMGTPLFMALPHHYSPQARERIARLLAIHRRHRRAIFDGVVLPIGREPSNTSWCGFQSWDGGAGEGGYLTVFRERLNPDPWGEVELHHVPAGTTLRFADLLADREWTAVAGEDGAIRLEIKEPGGFLFLRYDLRGAAPAPGFSHGHKPTR